MRFMYSVAQFSVAYVQVTVDLMLSTVQVTVRSVHTYTYTVQRNYWSIHPGQQTAHHLHAHQLITTNHFYCPHHHHLHNNHHHLHNHHHHSYNVLRSLSS